MNNIVGNVIVCDAEYEENRDYVNNYCILIDNTLKEYYECLTKMSETAIISGEVNEALCVYISYVKQLIGISKTVGEKFKDMCIDFIEEIDKADSYLYETKTGSKVTRDFTDEEFKNLKSMLDHPWCNFTDNIFDTILGWLVDKGFLDVTNYKNDLDVCHKRLMDYNDAAETTIRDIFRNVESVDRKYGKSIQSGIAGEDAYTSRFALASLSLCSLRNALAKMSEIVDPKKGEFTTENIHLGLSSIFSELNSYVVETIGISDPGIDITIEELEVFVENEANMSFYYNLTGPMSEEIGNMGTLDTISMIFFQGESVTMAELTKRGTVPPDIETEDIYAYLKVKKQLSDTIAKMADNEIDITEDSEAYLKAKEIIDAVTKHKKDYPGYEQYKVLYDGISECADTISEGIGRGIDIAEIIVPIFANYVKNEEIILSLGQGVDDNSILGIAVRELKREYQNKYIASLKNFSDYCLSEASKEIIKAGKKIVLKMAGKGAAGLYSAIEFAKDTAGSLTGLGQSSSSMLDFLCLYNTNSELQAAYEHNFKIVAEGSRSETDINNLKNSFELLKRTLVEEYELLAKKSQGNGNYNKKAYYEYVSKQISSMQMDQTEGFGKIISYEAYMKY